jgi:hypothetical protein
MNNLKLHERVMVIGGSVLGVLGTTAIVASATFQYNTGRAVAVLTEQVSKHDDRINILETWKSAGDRFTEDDARRDREVQATRDAQVMALIASVQDSLHSINSSLVRIEEGFKFLNDRVERLEKQND